MVNNPSIRPYFFGETWHWGGVPSTYGIGPMLMPKWLFLEVICSEAWNPVEYINLQKTWCSNDAAGSLAFRSLPWELPPASPRVRKKFLCPKPYVQNGSKSWFRGPKSSDLDESNCTQDVIETRQITPNRSVSWRDFKKPPDFKSRRLL